MNGIIDVCSLSFQMDVNMDDNMDVTVYQMGNLIALYKELGIMCAWLNWFDCYDINHISKQYLNNKANIGHVEHKIQYLRNQLSQCLGTDDFSTLITECLAQMESIKETTEQEIELKHRPHGVHFNENALIILTETAIPDDIKIALSFGYKFLFPFECNNKNMHEILAQLEMTIEQAIPDLKQDEAAFLISDILKKRDKFQEDNNLKWLKFISKRTSAFFKTNAHLFATKSDKGGHTVVAEVASYEHKLASLLNDNNYIELVQDTLLDLTIDILVEQDKNLYYTLKNALYDKNKEETKWFVDGLPLYEPDTFGLAKFYGLYKIHKEGIPLRPITSTVESPGFLLAKIFTKMLDVIFPRTKHHIKDSYEFVDFVNGVSIKKSDKLVSFDVVSMYTSIPYDLVREIIMSKADTFLRIFKIDADLLQRLIKHLLVDCMLFTALDKTYKQVDGLPMGSCVSPIIARIVMDKVIDDLLEKVPHFSFIKVFVDDTIASVNEEHVDEALEVLNNFRPGQIKFTIEHENDKNSINFLNVTLHRELSRVISRWYRKGFHSGRLLNYYSSHKRTTVMATATHFIKTILHLSDARYFHENVDVAKRTLLDNNFPESTVTVLMNECYTLMKPLYKTKKQKLENKYIMVDGQKTLKEYKIFPRSIAKAREIKKVLHDFKSPEIILADSVRNTRVNSITTRKTITPIAKRKNLILIARCVCKKRFKIVKTGFNETGQMTLKKIVTLKHKCDSHSHAYKKVQFHKGLYYDGQTSCLLRYIQWRYRKRFDVSQCRYQWPRFQRQFGKFV